MVNDETGPATHDDDIPSFDKLSPIAREALTSAMDVLFDEFLDDLVSLRDGDPFGDTSMAGVLPDKYNDLYDHWFARQFFVAYIHAVDRIRRGENPRCTAEELAVAAVFEYATTVFMDLREYDKQIVSSTVTELGDYHESMVEDLDYQWLFDPEMDGVEYIDQLHVANFRFSEWFQAFRDTAPVNPLLESERPDTPVPPSTAAVPLDEYADEDGDDSEIDDDGPAEREAFIGPCLCRELRADAADKAEDDQCPRQQLVATHNDTEYWACCSLMALGESQRRKK